jgi:hypothetical protein
MVWDYIGHTAMGDGNVFCRRHDESKVAMTASSKGCFVPSPGVGVEFLA